MKLHELPYKSLFRIPGHGSFQKGALTTKHKHAGYIGDGDYFCACFITEFKQAIPIRVWIGCDQEVETL